MNNHNTYNASFVFMSDKIDVTYTIVCNSEQGIDRNSVNEAIKQTFVTYEGKKVSSEFVIREAITRIRNTCGCNAVFVRSDINFVIPKK